MRIINHYWPYVTCRGQSLVHIMTSWREYMFGIIGTLLGESAGYRWIASTDASNTELWWILCCWPQLRLLCTMMTSSNWNTFRVAGHLCGEFPAQRPVMRSFDIFFDLRLNKRLGKQSWGWWFETLSRPLWRHSNDQSRRLVHGQKSSWRWNETTQLLCVTSQKNTHLMSPQWWLLKSRHIIMWAFVSSLAIVPIAKGKRFRSKFTDYKNYFVWIFGLDDVFENARRNLTKYRICCAWYYNQKHNTKCTWLVTQAKFVLHTPMLTSPTFIAPLCMRTILWCCRR